MEIVRASIKKSLNIFDDYIYKKDSLESGSTSVL